MGVKVTKVYSGSEVVETIRNIPAQRDGIKVSMTRDNWPEGDCLKVQIKGKVNDVPAGGAEAVFAGGEIIGRDGQPLTIAELSWDWPGETRQGQGREKIRITDVEVILTPLIGPISTEVNTETF